MTKRDIVRNLKFRKNDPAGFDAGKLAALLEKTVLEQRRPDQETQKVTFSPSTIGYGHGTCARYWSLAFTGADFVETTDALGVAVMSNGTFTHMRLQEVFKQTTIFEEEELEVKMTNPPVRGFVDVVINWEGESVIGEIKSTRQEAFDFRRTSMKPSANHLIQILIYMKATGKRTGFLMYENKNTQEFLIIPVFMTPHNEKLINSILEWMQAVYAWWENDTLPQKPVKRKDAKICQSCPVRKVCWEDTPEGDVLIPLMVVPKV